MERVISSNDSDIAAAPAFDPLKHPISARWPKRNDVLTAWIGHVPFAMTLVDLAKPRVFVELGTYWGVSYCAFCQAVKELRLGTRCYAVDTWQGDAHAKFYSNDVYEDLKAHHDEHYALFSTLVRSTFEDALPRISDGTVDILHIDGYHTYDAVKHDFETWLPKMSGSGIILFHDTELRDRETFGAWRFWDEVKQRYPHFEFYHSFGLGVLAVGSSIPAGTQALFSASSRDQELIREYFETLGDRLAEAHEVVIQRENLRELLEAKRDEFEKLTTIRISESDHLRSVEAQLNEARAALAATQEQLGRVRYRLTDRVARFGGKIPFVPHLTRSIAARLLRLTGRIK